MSNTLYIILFVGINAAIAAWCAVDYLMVRAREAGYRVGFSAGVDYSALLASEAEAKRACPDCGRERLIGPCGWTDCGRGPRRGERLIPLDTV